MAIKGQKSWPFMALFREVGSIATEHAPTGFGSKVARYFTFSLKSSTNIQLFSELFVMIDVSPKIMGHGEMA